MEIHFVGEQGLPVVDIGSRNVGLEEWKELNNQFPATEVEEGIEPLTLPYLSIPVDEDGEDITVEVPRESLDGFVTVKPISDGDRSGMQHLVDPQGVLAAWRASGSPKNWNPEE